MNFRLSPLPNFSNNDKIFYRLSWYNYNFYYLTPVFIIAALAQLVEQLFRK